MFIFNIGSRCISFLVDLQQSENFTHHFFASSDVSLKYTTFYEKFPCRACSFSFGNQRRLFTINQATHRCEPTLCEFISGHCNKTFTASKNLLRHFRKFQKFTKNVRCKACPKVYGNKSSLQNHISHEHQSVS